MNKNLTKKALIPAIAMVIASVIALSGVTYAWFTTGTTASVETLDVNVKTADGIQVSVDAKKWKSVITATDIRGVTTTTYSTHANQLPNPVVDPERPTVAISEIEPVSSAGTVVGGKLQLFKGMYDEATGNLISTADAEQRGESGNFIAFDLFFKSGGEAKTLKLVPGSSGDSAYVQCKALDDAASADSYTNTAVRVAFVNLGNADTPAEAQALGTNVNGTALIWEPNSKLRNDGSSSTKVDYYGFNSEFSGDDAVEPNEDGFAPSSSNKVSKVTTFDETQTIVTLNPGITKVRVYIWLEGQDIDCVNDISYGDFVTNLFFDVA